MLQSNTYQCFKNAILKNKNNNFYLSTLDVSTLDVSTLALSFQNGIEHCSLNKRIHFNANIDLSMSFKGWSHTLQIKILSQRFEEDGALWFM